MESLRLHAFIIFFKNNSQRHCRRPSGSILGLLMFCNLIIFAVLPKSMYNASFHYEQVRRIRILDLILILKSQISDSVTSCLIFF